MTEAIDCLVIGGGPAGLTAAIYLARFHLSVIVADEGHSRAALIPRTRNHAGYPEGITGPDLLDRMRRQAELYDVRIEPTKVTALEKAGDRFQAALGAGPVTARAVLLATGVVNHRPAMPDDLHDAALARGLLRYCPVCDGFEVTDQRVGVIGTGERGTNEAIFLRGYTRDVTIFAPDGPHDLADAQRGKLADAGVVLVDGPITSFAIQDGRLRIDAASGLSLVDSGLSGDGVAHSIGAGEGVRGYRIRRRLLGGGRAPADRHTRPLRGRRRGERARPDQPRHGRGRRRGHGDPERPGRARAALPVTAPAQPRLRAQCLARSARRATAAACIAGAVARSPNASARVLL